jgi:enolase-phosphatase E1
VKPSPDTKIRAILLDIEGTTTPIDFVYQVLFPYAKSHAGEFLRRHGGSQDVSEDLMALCEQHAEDFAYRLNPPPLEDTNDPTFFVAYIHWLIDHDRKLTPLKSLQGKIWADGYAIGDLRSQVFDDVPRALKRWREQGKQIAIFSSGSVLAQRLLFAHTEVGDWTEYFCHHFDTTIGSKADPASYRRIAETIGLPPLQIIFISDVTKELDAASTASFQTLLCERPGNHAQPQHNYKIVRSFDEAIFD